MSGGASAVPIGTLLWTVLEAIIEVFILCSAGYILARVGIADKQTQRKLNVINVSLFTPALLFGKIAFSLTPEKLKELWVIPLGFVIVTGVSGAVAWALGTLMGLSRSQRAYGIACSMFQNSNSLPIALIQSLVDEVQGLKWGKHDTRDAMLGRALTYLVLYSTLGMMLRWSYGVQLLSQADDAVPDVPAEQVTSAILTTEPEAIEGTDTNPHIDAQETDPLFSSASAMKRAERRESEGSDRRLSALSTTSSTFAWTANSALTMHPPAGSSPGTVTAQGLNAADMQREAGNSGFSRTSSGGRMRPKQMSRTESGRQFWGLPEVAKSRASLSDQEEEDEDESEAEDEEWGDSNLPYVRRRNFATPSNSRIGSLLRKIKTRSSAILLKTWAFLTVPMIAGILSIIIALIPPLQAALVASKPLTQAIRGAGQCSIPLTLVVLGAFFYSPPPPPPTGSRSKSKSLMTAAPKGPRLSFFERKLKALAHPLTPAEGQVNAPAHPGENKTVFVAVVSRMILVPAILLPVLALIARYDWFNSAEDPVFILAATLIISSPTALTISQLTEASNGLAFERLVTKTISWSYAVLTPPLTLLYVVLGLVFGRL